jgi:hypothetical protein
MVTEARMLRVFFDHGHRWPLWEVGDTTAMEPSDYGFSIRLTELLQRWHEAWEPIADFDIGQPVDPPPPGARDELGALGREALKLIRHEVPADIRIDDSLAFS